MSPNTPNTPLPKKSEKTPLTRDYRPPWKMIKQQILKEDGRYLIYYRFLPLSEEGIKQE